ncbi:hypothetical protein HJD18_01140 [Thermoleophilia bacterium SCSIO 60948]|nr:hypothetical protein HJD18_01140 [Thermoleophilia bacterium SCSIO 60948]
MDVDESSANDARADYASTLVGVGIVYFLFGAWLMISPFFIDYGDTGLDLNPVISGAVLAAIGLIRLTGSYASQVLSLLGALVGLWIIISGFVISETVVGTWNLGVTGAIAVVLTFVAEAATIEAPRRSRG